MSSRLLAACLLVWAIPAPALGDTTPCGPRFSVTFVDAEPDLFSIENLSGEGWELVGLSIVLAGSAGDLIFDTVAGGEGSGNPSAFFSSFASPVQLIDAKGADDGGRAVSLAFAGFAPGRQFDFHTDVDDRLPSSTFGAAHVDRGEFAGATAHGTFRGPTGAPVTIDATFDEKAYADSGSGGCV